MTRLFLIIFTILLIIAGTACSTDVVKGGTAQTKTAAAESGPAVKLPAPSLKGQASLEEALAARRSVRQYADAPVNLQQVSQLLWAAQGITSADGKRTAPSAIAIYPLQVYLIAGKVDGLDSGLYKYVPDGHQLIKMSGGDIRGDLSGASGSGASIKGAAVDFVITGDMAKMTKRAGAGSEKWVYVEAGHAAENLVLEATAMNLGSLTVGGINQDALKQALAIPDQETPIYILPVGQKK